MKQYYIHDGRNQHGPYTIEQLEAQHLKASTLVWSDDMDDWQKAESIPDLKGIIKKSPPPLKKDTPPPIKGKERSWFELLLKFILTFVMTVVISYLVLLFIEHQNQNGVESQKTNIKRAIKEIEKDNQKEYYRKRIRDHIKPYTNSYQKDLVFGGIWDLYVKIDNETPYFIENIAVGIRYMKTNGDIYKLENISFTNLEPGKQYVLPAPNSEKGTSVVCFIRGVKCSSLE